MTQSITEHPLSRCPLCNREGEYFNVFKIHFGVCDGHRLYWAIGCGLFSCWQQETKSDWLRNVEQLQKFQPASAEDFVAFSEACWDLENLLTIEPNPALIPYLQAEKIRRQKEGKQ